MAETSVKVLVLGDQWWRTDSVMSVTVHQFVHFLRRWNVSMQLMYPAEAHRLTESEKDEMSSCKLDRILCADCRMTLAVTEVPKDCLSHHYDTYYKYIFQDAETFSDITHIVAFAPELGNAAIRLREDFRNHYNKLVKVALINYRQLSDDSDEGFLHSLENQQWFAKRNVDHVWSIGQTLFNHYSTNYMHEPDSAPHEMLLFRPTFDQIQLNREQLKQPQFLTVLCSSLTTCTDEMKAVGKVVSDLQKQMVNVGQTRLQWKIVTENTNIIQNLASHTHGRQAINIINPKRVAGKRALISHLLQSRLYISLTGDDQVFNMLDWVLVGSGMPTLMSSFTCVGETLNDLGIHQSSILPKQVLVEPHDSQDGAWFSKINGVLMDGGGDVALNNSDQLRDLIQKSDLINQSESTFVEWVQDGYMGAACSVPTHTTQMGDHILKVYPDDTCSTVTVSADLTGQTAIQPGRSPPPISDVRANSPPTVRACGRIVTTSCVHSQLQRQSVLLTPVQLSHTADLVGNDWRKLGIELGLRYNALEELSTPHSGGPEEHAAKMLNKWWQGNYDKSYQEVQICIASALEKCYLKAVAVRVTDSDITTVNEMERMFRDISGSLVRDWRDVGCQLGLSYEDLNVISAPVPLAEKPCRRMLEMWSQNIEPERAVPTLMNALQNIGRQDVMVELGKMLQRDISDFSNRPVQMAPVSYRESRYQTSAPSPDHTSRQVPTVISQPSDVERDHVAETARGQVNETCPATASETSPPAGEDVPRLTTVDNISSLAEQQMPEDEMPDVDVLHRPVDQSFENNRELNPSFQWMGSEFERLRQSLDGFVPQPVVIALLDSGVNTSHPDLKHLVVGSKNFVPDVLEEFDLRRDKCNHGTFSAGIIWQYAGDRVVKVLSLKVLKTDACGSLKYVADALEYIKQWDTENPTMKVSIVLMTLGHPRRNKRLEKLLSETGEDKILISSAANEGQKRPNSVLSPANHGSVIAVGSCEESGNRCYHSAVGQELDFLFPGQNVQSTSSWYKEEDAETRYIIQSGTSFSAPHCAALAALLLTFVEFHFSGFASKSGQFWRKALTSSARMKELLREFCHREHNYEKGFGAPELQRVTKNCIEDYLTRHHVVKKLEIQ